MFETPHIDGERTRGRDERPEPNSLPQQVIRFRPMQSKGSGTKLATHNLPELKNPFVGEGTVVASGSLSTSEVSPFFHRCPDQIATMRAVHQIEERLNRILQDQILPISRELHVGWPNLPGQLTRQAQVLFLGNHSSGKSSFINHLLQSEVQKTGMAPTDDGFTILLQGNREDTIDGHAAVSNPAFTIGHLRNLGPAFLSRLRIKTHPSPFLDEIRLVDSPGMIDHPGEGQGRGYDFQNAVRTFAESSDLILVFFDPDKPGTTGETMSIFTETLSGLEHKIVILLHKVDQMESLADFARSYGTLCWNLSRKSPTKDMPQIFTTFIPEKVTRHRRNDTEALDLSEFSTSLEEVKAEINKAPLRRIDNLLTEVERRAHWLNMLLILLSHAQKSRWKTIALVWASAILCLTLGGVLAWSQRDSLQIAGGIALVALLLASTGYIAGTYALKLRQMRLQTQDGLDELFRSSYQNEFQIGHRADIYSLWATVKSSLGKIIKSPGLANLPGIQWMNKKSHSLSQLIQKDIPPLRQSTQEFRINGDIASDKNSSDSSSQ